MSARADALLAAIVKCSRLLARARDVPRAFADAVAALHAVVPIRRAGLALIDQQHSGFEFYLENGEPDPSPPGVEVRHDLHALMEDGETLQQQLNWPLDPAGAIGLWLPMVRGLDSLGLIALIPETVPQPSSQVVDALQVWAYMFGGVVARSRRYREGREREALHRFALRLSSELNLERVFPRAISELKDELGFDDAALLVLDESRQALCLLAGTAEPPDDSWRVIPLEGTASGEASASGQNVIVDDTSSGEFKFDRALQERGVQSHVAQPLLKSGRVVGSLNLISSRRGGFATINRDLLAAVGSTLALAVDNALLFERVRESEDRYASVVEKAGELIYRLDLRGRITFANQTARTLLGRDPEELIGCRALSLVAPMERRKGDLGALVLGGRDDLRIDLDLRTSDDRWVPTKHHIHVILDRDGERRGYQGIALDMTGEREVARVTQLHEDLVDMLDDLVFMANTSGQLLAVNRKAREVLGWESEDVSRMTILDLHPPEEHALVAKVRQQLIDTGASPAEFHVRTRSGDLVPTRARLTYSPRTGTMQGVFRDVREEQLVQDRLLQVERLSALGEMATSVAHTFNNLLAVIGTTAQVAKRLTDDQAVVLELDAIQHAVSDGGAAVRHIQSLAHQPAAHPFEKLDLNATLRDVASQARRQHRSDSGVHLDIAMELGDPAFVGGSERELNDVFLSLMINAMEAMPTGGVVRLQSKVGDGRVLVSVVDEGSGMTPDVHRQIFTPFFTTKGRRGAGLGLTIALNVVASHGGSVKVSSSEGQGTRVEVTLPLFEPEEPPSRRLSILVVAGEPLLRVQLERRLQKRGHLPRLVEDGSAAIAALAADDFDCAFVDFALSDPSAFDVADAAAKQSTRVVLLASWRDQIVESAVSEHGVAAVLRKPFQTSALVNQLQLCPHTTDPS